MRHCRHVAAHFMTFISTSMRPNEPEIVSTKPTVRLLELIVEVLTVSRVTLHVPTNGTIVVSCWLPEDS